MNTKHPPDIKRQKKIYNAYFQNDASRYTTSYGLRFVEAVCEWYKPTAVLDAGCGGGMTLRAFKQKGYKCCGVEISDWVVKKACPDLLKDKTIIITPLQKIPFEANSFDLVFCADVLEHIPAADIPDVVAEIVRVTSRNIFLSISLRPSCDNNRYHVTLQSRKWWEQQFVAAGAVVDKKTVQRFQKRIPGADNADVLRTRVSEPLLREMQWFLDNPPYDLHGETEPWIFAFFKE